MLHALPYQTLLQLPVVNEVLYEQLQTRLAVLQDYREHIGSASIPEHHFEQTSKARAYAQERQHRLEAYASYWRCSESRSSLPGFA